MTTWSSRTTYQGRAINQGTNQILKAANKILSSSAFGAEKGNMTMLQGGYNRGGVAASAGTHDGGGAFDLTPYNYKNRIKVLRILGCAAWYRPYNWDRRGGGAHIHVEVCGDGSASAGGKQQVNAYYNNRNGLANNAKDPDWRPAGIPILFRLDADLAVRYATRNTVPRNAPSGGGLPRGLLLKKGAKFTPVAIVKNKAGELWVINVDGKCVALANLTKTKPAAPKPEPTPPVKPIDPKPAATVTFTTGTINVIRWRLGQKNERKYDSWEKGLNYFPERVKGIAKLRDTLGMSLFTTTESGQYGDADKLTNEMGKTEWDNILHGDAAGDITQAVHFHNKRKMLKEGSYTTGNAVEAAYHNTATWVLTQDVKSGVIFLNVAHHADYRPRDEQNFKYDKVREKHTKVLIAKAEDIALAAAKEYKVKVVPVVFSGDFNSDSKQKYDGVGKAMAAAGYIDTYDFATERKGLATTTNGLDPKKTTGRRLDRIFVKKGTAVGVINTLLGYPYTDHNAVGVTITLKNS